MGIKFANNSESTLDGVVLVGDLTIQIAAGEGARFPAVSSPDYFYGTLVDVSGNREIVKVTSHVASAVTMTVERAADPIANGTPTALEFASGSKFQMRTNALALADSGTGASGTISDTWQIDNENSGPQIKNNAGVLEARNAADDAYADFTAAALILGGTVTGVTDLVASGDVQADTVTVTDQIDLSGGQIKFPSTAVPSADTNTLDDYEEGVWAPLAADASTGGNTNGGSSSGGTYTKIGKTVFFSMYINGITTATLTAGNRIHIQGLPFTPIFKGEGWVVAVSNMTVDQQGIVGKWGGDNAIVFDYWNSTEGNYKVSDLHATITSITVTGHYTIS